MLQKPIGITVMLSMYMHPYGITGVAMQYQTARPIPIRWKGIMPNLDIIWPALLVLLAAFLVVRMLYPALFVYLSITSISAN